VKFIFHYGAQPSKETAEKEQFLRENMVCFNSGELTTDVILANLQVVSSG